MPVTALTFEELIAPWGAWVMVTVSVPWAPDSSLWMWVGMFLRTRNVPIK